MSREAILAQVKKELSDKLLPVLKEKSPSEREYIYGNMSTLIFSIMKTGTFQGHQFDDQDLLEILEWCRQNV